MKICNKCLTEKETSDFCKNRSNPDGLSRRCRLCTKEYKRVYNIEHGHRVRVEKYGISKEKYGLLLKQQNGLCAICFTEPNDKRLSIDHNHKCCPNKKKSCGNCVRGLICNDCNMAIGLMRDSADRLQNAAIYLMQFENILN